MHDRLLTDWWSSDNTDAYFPRPLITGGSDGNTAQTRYLQNAAYMRLKQLTLGYTIPQHLTQKVMVNRIRVYFTGNNALDIINNMYKNVTDPEMDNAKGYPIHRSYSLGAKSGLGTIIIVDFLKNC